MEDLLYLKQVLYRIKIKLSIKQLDTHLMKFEVPRIRTKEHRKTKFIKMVKNNNTSCTLFMKYL